MKNILKKSSKTFIKISLILHFIITFLLAVFLGVCSLYINNMLISLLFAGIAIACAVYLGVSIPLTVYKLI